MLKAYKVRLYPNIEQQDLINRTFGCVRKVWNLMRDDFIKSYEETGKGRIKTPAKYKSEFEFLKEVDSFALCNAQMNLQTAYKNFFEGLQGKRRRVGYPKVKSRKNSKRTYTTNNNSGQVRIQDGKLRLPKVGLIKAVFHRYVRGAIKSVTVSQNAQGHYYASILTEYAPETKLHVVDNEKVVGVDMSLSELAVMSDGTRAKYPRWYRQSEKRLAKAQRQLSRKKKGSANREKQRRKVARIHEKVANQRKDYLHKLSYRLAEEFDVAVVEDIDLQGMAQALNFAKSVHDAGFGQFRQYLKYKMEDRLKTFVKANRWFASSQTCSECGNKHALTKDLSVRSWVCPSCGVRHDRDVNAARNLVNWYLTTVAETESNACGDGVRLPDSEAVVCEAGKVDGTDPSSPRLQSWVS